MNALTRSALLLFIMVLAAGCGRPSWQELAIRDGGFSILMRPNPHYEKRALETAAGRIVAQMYSTETQDSVFGVGFSDYPEEMVRTMAPRRLFMAVRDTWVRRIDGKLQGDGIDIRLDGKHPGMEVVAWGTVSGREAYLKARFYLVGNRLFQVVVFGRRDSMPLAEVNRFLASFKLIPQREVGSLAIEPPPDKKP